MACGWNIFVSDKSSRNYRQIYCFRHCLQFVRTISYYPKSWELVPTVFYWRSNDKKLADFLIHFLINDPERSEYLKQFPPKGIPINLFFIADISKTSISNINADGNSAYLKSRNTNKFYYCDNDQASIIREDISGKFYYNDRLCRNSYKTFYIL